MENKAARKFNYFFCDEEFIKQIYGGIKFMTKHLSIFILSPVFLFIAFQSRAEGIQNIAKAILYLEQGDLNRAYDSIYRHELTNSAIVSIIISKVKKDISVLQGTFWFVPDLENEFKDRIRYELSKILFHKGDYAEAKNKINEITQKADSVKFVMANIAFVEGDYSRAGQNISDIVAGKYTNNNSVRYRKLKRAIDEENSSTFFLGDFYSSVFFTTPNPPVRFENSQTPKRWDIMSNFYGKVHGEPFRYFQIRPFFRYEFGGEFYTDIDNFTLHKITVGWEYSRSLVAGIKYSPLISTFQNDIFSVVHKFGSYLFPIRLLFLGLNFGLESKNKIDERKGVISSAEAGVKLEKKFGSLVLGNLSFLELGKRFAKTRRFSEIFASPHLRNYLKVGDFQVDLNLLFSFRMFPDRFEGRSMDSLWFVELSPVFTKEFVRLEFIKFVAEGNLSDSDVFSWFRLRVGAAASMLF